MKKALVSIICITSLGLQCSDTPQDKSNFAIQSFSSFESPEENDTDNCLSAHDEIDLEFHRNRDSKIAALYQSKESIRREKSKLIAHASNPENRPTTSKKEKPLFWYTAPNGKLTYGSY